MHFIWYTCQEEKTCQEKTEKKTNGRKEHKPTNVGKIALDCKAG